MSPSERETCSLLLGRKEKGRDLPASADLQFPSAQNNQNIWGAHPDSCQLPSEDSGLIVGEGPTPGFLGKAGLCAGTRAPQPPPDSGCPELKA